MTPTNKLRFVRRPEFEPDGPPFIRVLQQWWEDQSTDVNWVHGNPGEWRDVPLEREE